MQLPFPARVQWLLDLEHIFLLGQNISLRRFVTKLLHLWMFPMDVSFQGAVLQDKTALHVSITHSPSNSLSVSTQIAFLRRLLNGSGNGDLGEAFKSVVKVGFGC